MPTYGSTYVDAPVISPYSFGLLDTVPVLPLAPHESFGTVHESEFCGAAARSYAAACATPGAAAGTASISNGGSPNRTATLTVSGSPLTVYWVDWGDGTTSPPGAVPMTHNYAANGTYTVKVSGQAGWSATVTNTVAATANGPFTGAGTMNAPKTANDGTSVVEGKPFTIYHLFTCRTVGEWTEAEARARKALELGEHIPVELGFQQIALAGATDDTPGGTPVDIVDGLAILEQAINRAYTG